MEEQNLLDTFKKVCTAEGIQFYSTMKETKVAFAKPTVGSMKKDFYIT